MQRYEEPAANSFRFAVQNEWEEGILIVCEGQLYKY